MKFKCLVLDHDDTVVNSTATIHYPCFIQYLEERYPDIAGSYTLESYFVKNFHPGVISLFRDEIGMSEEEMKREEAYWADYVASHIPTAYEGMKEIIEEFRKNGGIIAVDSHSLTRYIERDWEANLLPKPDIIYGWDLPKEQRKPSPYTLFDLMKRYSLKAEEIIVVDDLKPGFDMARGAGVVFAAAGWANNVPEIEKFMRRHCDYYLEKTEDLRKLLFS